MDAKSQVLHVAFLPFMQHGHMIPTLDLARLFTAHDGVKATIITTPLNVDTFSKAVESSKKRGGPDIAIEVIRFPAQEVGLPEGYENMKHALKPEFLHKFFQATKIIQEQLEHCLEKICPNCLVADMCFPWATESAAKFNIPRLVFHGISNFALCAQEIIRLYQPYKNVSSNEDRFVLPSLPHEVHLTKLQISEYLRNNEDNELTRRMSRIKESEIQSYGVIVNSFYELEPDYADFYKKELERRAWNVGPVSLSNTSTEDKAQRGKQASIDEHECLKWLSSKKPDSVIYLCFGSTATFGAPQLHEIAMALEASGQDFIWVVPNDDIGKSEDWLPAGFEQWMEKEGKGLIIRGWAPQVLILEQEAIGAFVTHCGWNSILEGISAGVSMVTWPICSEQFYNEKLITQILKIGIAVGAKKWCRTPSVEEMVNHQAIEKAFRDIMEGNESEEMRTRAKKLQEGAHKAFGEGGSSSSDLSALINELRCYQS